MGSNVESGNDCWSWEDGETPSNVMGLERFTSIFAEEKIRAGLDKLPKGACFAWDVDLQRSLTKDLDGDYGHTKPDILGQVEMTVKGSRA